MSSFFITGKQGTGKGLVSAGKIVEYLQRGSLVATNLDIFPDRYFNAQSKKTVIRLPDKPTLDDFKIIGSANETYDEEKNGLLVLDELGDWFNARKWQDKERQELLTYFLYLRKRGWDVLLLVQDISMVDAQLISQLGEHLVTCKRLDKMPIPFLGKWIRRFGGRGTLPKVHRAKVFLGSSTSDLHIDTWTFWGTEFYNLYDTKQIFSYSYPHGVHSVLSAWHTKGRYLSESVSFLDRFKINFEKLISPPRPVVSLKPKHLLVERVSRLPSFEQRLEFTRRFIACGAFDRQNNV